MNIIIYIEIIILYNLNNQYYLNNKTRIIIKIGYQLRNYFVLNYKEKYFCKFIMKNLNLFTKLNLL